MAAGAPSVPAAVALPRRPLAARLSAGHLLMVVAALLALVLNASVLRAAERTVPVAVAAVTLRAGAPVDSSQFRFTNVRVDDELRATLLGVEEVEALDGWVVAAPVAVGNLVRRSDLQRAAAPDRRRAMSIPVPAEHAAGGAISAGDRVDVIAVHDGTARYIVSDAEVLAVPAAGRAALGGVQQFSVTIAVDATSALHLAEAIRGQALEIVRSTGAASMPSSQRAREEEVSRDR